jgi:hypothetical protein
LTNRIQILRSSTPGNVPAVSTRSPGELWTNFPDKQLGHIDTSQTAQKLLAVRFFSTLASYVAGDLVAQAGAIYAANTTIPASAFNPAQWDKVVTVSALPAPYVLPTASTTVKGGVMVDGVTVIIDGTGKISAEGAVTVNSAPPSAPYVGALWYDTIGGQLYVYYFDGNSSQWVAASNQNIAGLYLPMTGGALTGPLSATRLDATPIGGTTPAAGSFTNLTATAATVTSLNSGQLAGMRNLIINGDMRIDQRNNGAVVNPAASGYVIDRWIAGLSAGGLLNFQRLASTNPGSAYALVAANAVTHTPGTGEVFNLNQRIEGLNAAHLQWGTPNALPVTVSFTLWANAAGSISAALSNAGTTRSYVTTVPVTTIPTRVSFTVPGDTAGTWATDNTLWAYLMFDLGSGSTLNAATANTWMAGNFQRLASQTLNIVSSSGSSLLIKDVQVEMGSVATPFERRPIGSELALCQRYYQKLGGVSASIGAQGYAGVSTTFSHTIGFAAMRAAPAAAFVGAWTNSNAGTPVIFPGTQALMFQITPPGAGNYSYYATDATAFITLSAEL